MTTTATPTKKGAPSDQLAKLEKRRRAEHAKAQEARRTAGAYDAETEAMRHAYSARMQSHPEETDEGANPKPLPGTELERMQTEIRRRRATPNPHRAAYEQARDTFHEADSECQKFRRAHVRDLLAELDPEYQAARDEMLDGWAGVVRGSDRFQEVVNRAREIICATPGLDGQALGHDHRPGEWKRLAVGALDAEIIKPRLTEMGEWRVNQ